MSDRRDRGPVPIHEFANNWKEMIDALTGPRREAPPPSREPDPRLQGATPEDRSWQIARALKSIPKAYANVRLDASLAAYVRDPKGRPFALEVLRTPPRAVVLAGPSGAGKTSLAAAMFRAFVERALAPEATKETCNAARKSFFVSALALARARAGHRLGRGEPALVERALRASLLVLDDVGNDAVMHDETVKFVVFERYQEGRPFWITTGLDERQLGARYGAGTVRRIFERARLLTLGLGSRTDEARSPARIAEARSSAPPSGLDTWRAQDDTHDARGSRPRIGISHPVGPNADPRN